MKRLFAWVKKPGAFSKIIVVFCLIYSVRIIEWAMRQFEETQMEATTLITVSIGLFGGELLLLCLKRVFSKNDKKELKSEEVPQPFVPSQYDGCE